MDSFNLLFALGGEVLELAKCACCGCGLGQSNKSGGVRNRKICGIHKRFEPWVGVWEATKGVLTIWWHIRLELGEQRRESWILWDWSYMVGSGHVLCRSNECSELLRHHCSPVCLAHVVGGFRCSPFVRLYLPRFLPRPHRCCSPPSTKAECAQGN